MPILDIQKRARELGRIRMGQVQDTGRTRDDGSKILRPAKLDRFRLTSPSKPLLDKVAELYGGEVRDWQPQGGGPAQHEVLITSQRLPIMVPPQPVTQWLEHWTGGGCKRRCDGATETLSEQPCICKANSDGDNDALLCKPTTRLNVVLRDVEGIGVWRLETHGWHAAQELPAVADFLSGAPGYVPAWLTLEEKKITAEVTVRGEVKTETRRFMVPKIDVDVTPAQLLAGQGAVTPAALGTGGPVPPAQIEAGPAASADASPQSEQVIVERIQAAATIDELTSLMQLARALGYVESEESPAWREGLRRRAALEVAASVKADEEQPAAIEAEPDPDLVWQQILKVTGEWGWDLSALRADYASTNGGVDPDTASGSELQAYLVGLHKRSAQAAATEADVA